MMKYKAWKNPPVDTLHWFMVMTMIARMVVPCYVMYPTRGSVIQVSAVSLIISQTRK